MNSRNALFTFAALGAAAAFLACDATGTLGPAPTPPAAATTDIGHGGGSAAETGTVTATATATGNGSPTTGKEDCRAPAGTAGHYASVNGLSMYYEVHGSGQPLVLLHGALTTIESSFSNLLPALACTRQVIAIEQQAHGRTADVDRPLSYEQMADDTVQLLRQIGIQQADFFGYSMGAATALQIAVAHPQIVRRLVVLSGGFNNDAYQPEMLAFMKSIDPANAPWAEEFREEFQRVAPRPEQWPAPLARIKELVTGWNGIDPEAIKTVQVPTLVIQGDADTVRIEHTVQLFHLLPHAQLAVLPGTDHYPGVVNRPQWLLTMIPPFLAAPAPTPAPPAP